MRNVVSEVQEENNLAGHRKYAAYCVLVYCRVMVLIGRWTFLALVFNEVNKWSPSSSGSEDLSRHLISGLRAKVPRLSRHGFMGFV